MGKLSTHGDGRPKHGRSLLPVYTDSLRYGFFPYEQSQLQITDLSKVVCLFLWTFHAQLS